MCSLGDLDLKTRILIGCSQGQLRPITIGTSDDCDCKQVTKKSPPVLHVVRHIEKCLEIKFRWNRTKLKFWRCRRPFREKPEVGGNFRFRHHVQRTRFTQKTQFQADPMKSVFVIFYDSGHFENGGHLENSEKSLRPSERLTFTSPSFMFVSWAVFSVGCGQVHGRGKKQKK